MTRQDDVAQYLRQDLNSFTPFQTALYHALNTWSAAMQTTEETQQDAACESFWNSCFGIFQLHKQNPPRMTLEKRGFSYFQEICPVVYEWCLANSPIQNKDAFIQRLGDYAFSKQSSLGDTPEQDRIQEIQVTFPIVNAVYLCFYRCEAYLQLLQSEAQNAQVLQENEEDDEDIIIKCMRQIAAISPNQNFKKNILFFFLQQQNIDLSLIRKIYRRLNENNVVKETQDAILSYLRQGVTSTEDSTWISDINALSELKAPEKDALLYPFIEDSNKHIDAAFLQNVYALNINANNKKGLIATLIRAPEAAEWLKTIAQLDMPQDLTYSLLPTLFDLDENARSRLITELLSSNEKFDAFLTWTTKLGTAQSQGILTQKDPGEITALFYATLGLDFIVYDPPSFKSKVAIGLLMQYLIERIDRHEDEKHPQLINNAAAKQKIETAFACILFFLNAPDCPEIVGSIATILHDNTSGNFGACCMTIQKIMQFKVSSSHVQWGSQDQDATDLLGKLFAHLPPLIQVIIAEDNFAVTVTLQDRIHSLYPTTNKKTQDRITQSFSPEDRFSQQILEKLPKNEPKRSSLGVLAWFILEPPRRVERERLEELNNAISNDTSNTDMQEEKTDTEVPRRSYAFAADDSDNPPRLSSPSFAERFSSLSIFQAAPSTPGIISPKEREEMKKAFDLLRMIEEDAPLTEIQTKIKVLREESRHTPIFKCMLDQLKSIFKNEEAREEARRKHRSSIQTSSHPSQSIPKTLGFFNKWRFSSNYAPSSPSRLNANSLAYSLLNYEPDDLSLYEICLDIPSILQVCSTESSETHSLTYLIKILHLLLPYVDEANQLGEKVRTTMRNYILEFNAHLPTYAINFLTGSLDYYSQVSWRTSKAHIETIKAIMTALLPKETRMNEAEIAAQVLEKITRNRDYNSMIEQHRGWFVSEQTQLSPSQQLVCTLWQALASYDPKQNNTYDYDNESSSVDLKKPYYRTPANILKESSTASLTGTGSSMSPISIGTSNESRDDLSERQSPTPNPTPTF